MEAEAGKQVEVCVWGGGRTVSKRVSGVCLLVGGGRVPGGESLKVAQAVAFQVLKMVRKGREYYICRH